MLWEACGADRDVAEMWALAFFFLMLHLRKYFYVSYE